MIFFVIFRLTSKTRGRIARFAIVGGEEEINFPFHRTIGHQDITRIHEEQFGKSSPKGLRFRVEVLLLIFLHALEPARVNDCATGALSGDRRIIVMTYDRTRQSRPDR